MWQWCILEQLQIYLRIQLCVPSNSFGLMMFVREATDAAQYALLSNKSIHLQFLN